MTAVATSNTISATAPGPAKCPRPFVVGSTGWSADDLDDPRIERLWERGRYEIVEGVLTKMPPALFDGSVPVGRLQSLIAVHMHATGQRGDFASEVDFIVNRKRIARADLIFMTPEDLEHQLRANRERAKPRPKVRFGRLLVPPTLVIESVSKGHEEHDRDTKRGWYAAAGVRHYWLLDPYERAFECLALAGAEYRTEQAGRDRDEIQPSLFPGLVIDLATLWP